MFAVVKRSDGMMWARQRVQAAFFVGILLFATNRPAFSQDLDQSLALAAMGKATDSIRSFDVFFTVDLQEFFDAPSAKEKQNQKLARREKPLTRSAHWRQVFRGGSGSHRAEKLSADMNRASRVIVANGTYLKSWNSQSYQCYIDKPGLSVIDPGSDYLETFASGYGVYSLTRIFGERKKIETRRSEDGESIELYTPTCRKESGVNLNFFGYRVRLNPKRNMLPDRIEVYVDMNGESALVKRVSINKYEEVESGVFAPLTAAIENLNVAKEFGYFGEVISKASLTVDRGRSHWNQDLPDSLFELSLPAGTQVIDGVRNISYVTGKPDPGKNLDDLAASAKFVIADVRPHSSSGAIVSSLDNGSFFRTWSVFLLTSVLLMFGFGLVWRRWKSQL